MCFNPSRYPPSIVIPAFFFMFSVSNVCRWVNVCVCVFVCVCVILFVVFLVDI